MENFSTGNARTAKRTTLVSRHYSWPARPRVAESSTLARIWRARKQVSWHTAFEDVTALARRWPVITGITSSIGTSRDLSDTRKNSQPTTGGCGTADSRKAEKSFGHDSVIDRNRQESALEKWDQACFAARRANPSSSPRTAYTLSGMPNEMLSRSLPFKAGYEQSVIHATLSHDPEPLRRGQEGHSPRARGGSIRRDSRLFRMAI